MFQTGQLNIGHTDHATLNIHWMAIICAVSLCTERASADHGKWPFQQVKEQEGLHRSGHCMCEEPCDNCICGQPFQTPEVDLRSARIGALPFLGIFPIFHTGTLISSLQIESYLDDVDEKYENEGWISLNARSIMQDGRTVLIRLGRVVDPMRQAS
jgi:hypothetical protein